MSAGLSIGLVSGLAWFAVFGIVHLSLLHRRAVRERFRLVLRVFVLAAAGHLATSAVLRFACGLPGGALEASSAVVSGWLVLACLFVLYMPFLFTISASLSVQTLVLVRRAPARRLPVEQLRARFASPAILGARLETMVNSGYLERSGGGYLLTRKGALVARCFAALKRLWRLGPGG